MDDDDCPLTKRITHFIKLIAFVAGLPKSFDEEAKASLKSRGSLLCCPLFVEGVAAPSSFASNKITCVGINEEGKLPFGVMYIAVNPQCCWLKYKCIGAINTIINISTHCQIIINITNNKFAQTTMRLR